MIYKVLYQKNTIQNPRRETTQTLYLNATSLVDAREKIEKNTPYNVEFIQELTGNSLDYEKNLKHLKSRSFSRL
ncbi:DNA-dependent RNA polymerase subunit epsilon [Holzapfeliella floricola]|uniref:DNA-dependent RNA polymerase subunit epsilon n=1 Tax=Holzapfeliella floricola TaxID=679249 RepID=UPI00078252D6|nr:DNA-directed RNA polymerase subunit epsilon [Holzapfeliella floricola]